MVKTTDLVTVPGSRLGGVASRASSAASDLAGIGRRTCEYARPLGSVQPPLGASVRARMIAAAVADELVITLMRQAMLPGGESAFAAGEAEAPELVDLLEQEGVLDDPASYHQAPHVPDLEWTSRSVMGRRFEQVTFRSPYAPPASVPGAIRYAQQTDNAVARAWMLRQTQSAPWVVCVHGAGMGDPLADLVLFRARTLHAQGFNVAIAVLPHHGPRGLSRFDGSFPSVDVVSNLHGASQAIADVRAVLAYVEARGERAALHGISLGSYVAASVAALEPRVRAVVVGVPVVNLARIMRLHTPEQRAQEPRFVEMLDHALALEGVTSPIRLGRPATPVRRIYAGRADRLVPADQVQELVEHWELDDATWYTGGHLAFMTSKTARRCLEDALVDAELASRSDDGSITALPA